MNILACTSFDFRVPCAGLNRLFKMKKALSNYGSNLVIIASGLVNEDRVWESNSDGNITYNRQLFRSLGYSKTLRITGQSKIFYKSHLNELIERFQVSGIIIYSMQAQLISSILTISKSHKIFTVINVSEYFKISFHFLLNGMNFQQALTKYYFLKKTSGLIATTPAWSDLANKINLPNVLIPEFMGGTAKKSRFREKAPSEFKIVFMSRLVGREMPHKILQALKVCNSRGLNFKLTILRGNSNTYRDKFWLWYVNRYKKLNNKIEIYDYISDDRRDNILEKADIFILLRRSNIETLHAFPSRILEYLMHGKPAIITNTSPLNFFFQDDIGVKFISKKNNPNELAELITALARNKEKSKAIGLKGKEFLIKNFNSNLLGKKLNLFLNKLK